MARAKQADTDTSSQMVCGRTDIWIGSHARDLGGYKLSKHLSQHEIRDSDARRHTVS